MAFKWGVFFNHLLALLIHRSMIKRIHLIDKLITCVFKFLNQIVIHMRLNAHKFEVDFRD